jgi:hypothetical protein
MDKGAEGLQAHRLRGPLEIVSGTEELLDLVITSLPFYK